MNKTTNTTGVIAAAVQQKPAAPTDNKPRTPAQALNSLLNGAAIQQTLKSTLKENSGAFVTSVMNLFNNDNPATWYEINAERVSFTGEKSGNAPNEPTQAPPVPPPAGNQADSDDDYPF